MTVDELIRELEWVKDEALGDLWSVHGDRCCGGCSCEGDSDRVEAAIDTAIERLRGTDNVKPLDNS